MLVCSIRLTTRGIRWLERIKIFVINAMSLLVLNILRIIVLAVLLVNSSVMFETLHFIFWHIISVIFVVAIWIFSVRYYKIKGIPVYSDIVYLKRLIKRS